MKKRQAKGYLFEDTVMRLLGEHGYIDINRNVPIRGRGAQHEIDSYGILNIPTPFVNKVRLFCECKYYAGPISLSVVRNFVGVIKDISENYFIRNDNEMLPLRYTDTGCIFSVNAISLPAQCYAWAHNIYIVTFNEIPEMRELIDRINMFIDQYPEDIDLSKQRLIRLFNEFRGNINLNMQVGYINGLYPIILTSEENWLSSIQNQIAQNDILSGIKNYRQDHDNDSVFYLTINGSQVTFSLNRYIAKILISDIDSRTGNANVFYIDIPIILRKDHDERLLRRILRINVDIYGFEHLISQAQ